MGGGTMIRAAGRAVGAGIGPGAVSAVKPKPTSFVSLPSPSSSSVTLPVSVTSSTAATASRASAARFMDEDDWVHVPEQEGFRHRVSAASSQRHVFGPVPSLEEVETAVSALQQVIVPAAYSLAVENGLASTTKKDVMDHMTTETDCTRAVSSIKSDLDLNEPILHLGNPTPKAAQLQSYNRIVDALQLLQTNPSVQRMVVSLSSDRAVWDAVMNNEGVKELKESFYSGKINRLESSEGEPSVAMQFLSWILDNMKVRIAETMDRILKLMNDLFRSSETERGTDIFQETLRSSVMLSILVLLVVVVSRVQST